MKQKGSVLQQIERDRQSLEDGFNRATGKNNKITQASLRSEPHKVIESALEAVSSKLNETIEDELNKPTGRPMSWVNDLATLDPDLLALIGLSTCMDAQGSQATYNWTVNKIGRRVGLELWAAQVRAEDKKFYDRVTKKAITDHTSERYRTEAVLSIGTRKGYQRPEFVDIGTSTTSARWVQAGQPILNAILSSCDVFEIYTNIVKNKTRRHIVLTAEASQQIAEGEYEAAWLEPIFTPMIVPPKPWTTFYTGAYEDPALAEQCELVRAASPWQRKEISRQLRRRKQPPYIRALNRIQATPFKINEPILDAVVWAFSNNLSIGKFPRKEHIEPIEFPEDYDSLAAFQKKELRVKARNIFNLNKQIDGDRAVMAQDLKTAKDLSSYEEFYLPCNFDFRGRVYPIPPFSPHRDDHIKAMFYLANVRPITRKGFEWLKIHLANVGDFDKVSKQSFDGRMKWTDDNHDMIMSIAADYQGNLELWAAADKPFQFLAACLEYARYQNEGDGMLSGLPLGLDGTNSGIQHFSTLARNMSDAYLVNLIPQSVPNDIYQAVADKCIEFVKADVDNPIAKLWLDHGIDRKIVKRNVMTYGYSSRLFGFKNQIMDDLMRQLDRKVKNGDLDSHPFTDDFHTQVLSAEYLAKQNWTAINEVISSAKEGMAFLQELSHLVSNANEHMHWYTPVQFPAAQFYPQRTVKKIKVYLHDRTANVRKRTQVSLKDVKVNTIDVRKSKTAIAPNFIHSLDSAHLIQTVLCMLKKRPAVKDFMLIHDSFATTPAQTEKLYHGIREAFVEMYNDRNYYSELLETCINRLGRVPQEEDLPNLPQVGTMDVTVVLSSKYCFS